MSDDAREAIAAYFEAQARRRGESAAANPDEVRERRSARGILDIADYVRELPEDDARIDRISALSVELRPEPSATLAIGPGAAEIAYGFRYDDPLDSPDALLDRFATAVEDGAAACYAEGRSPSEIADDLGSESPTRALLALRYVADNVDAWEDVAVARAREAGWSWERIATVLGRSRQSVWSKHREAERTSPIAPIARAPRAVAALAKAAITRVPHGAGREDGTTLVVEPDQGTQISDPLATEPAGIPEAAPA